MKKYIGVVFCILFSWNAIAQESEFSVNKKWFVPDYARLQFAGNIGFMSAGVGYELFHKKIATEFIYGYVPEEYAHTTIHTITFKTLAPIIRKQWLNLIWKPYMGFAFSYETGHNSFVSLPDYFPEGYYASNAFHLSILAGLEIRKDFVETKFISGIGAYAEAVTVDSFFWYKVNSRQVKVYQVVSLALGVNIYF